MTTEREAKSLLKDIENLHLLVGYGYKKAKYFADRYKVKMEFYTLNSVQGIFPSLKEVGTFTYRGVILIVLEDSHDIQQLINDITAIVKADYKKRLVNMLNALN